MATQPFSKYDVKVAPTTSEKPTSIRETSTVGPSSTSAFGSTSQNVQETTTYFNPLAQSSLDSLLRMLVKGNAPGYSTDKREALHPMLQSLLQDYSKQNAFNDAQGLVALSLQKAMEQSGPAISRSIEGAGTSAGSMQALLAGNASRDAALSASALGAEQAKSYGNISSNLLNLLELTSRPDSTLLNSLIQALNISKGGTVARNATSTGSTSEEKLSSGSTTTSNKSIGYGDGTAGESSGGLSYIGPDDSRGGAYSDKARMDPSLGSYGSYSNNYQSRGGTNITDYLGVK
jgi:hypothetical protein